MVARLTLDKDGRFVLHAHLRKKRGIWVYRSGKPLSDAEVQQTVRQVRRKRDKDNVGKGRSEARSTTRCWRAAP